MKPSIGLSAIFGPLALRESRREAEKLRLLERDRVRGLNGHGFFSLPHPLPLPNGEGAGSSAHGKLLDRTGAGGIKQSLYLFSIAALSALLIMAPLAAHAASVEIRRFEDPAKQERYEELIKELRCLVCQNQALSDSDADLAKDLRDEVYRIIQSGKTDQEAVDFLVSRYGDFVLYRPPFKPLTLFLWGGPLLLLLIGATVLWRQWRGHRGVETPPLSEADRERLQRLRAQTDRIDDEQP